MNNRTIAMGNGYFVCHSEIEKKAVERFMCALSEESLYTINKILEPYREKMAKADDKERKNASTGL